MSDLVYPKIKGAIAGLSSGQGPIDWDADTFYCALVTATYVTTSLATLKTHQFKSDVDGVAGGEVANGAGYTTGGKPLASITITASGDNYIIDAADLVWATATITARGLVIYKVTGGDLLTPGNDPLILLLDFGSNITSTGGNFTVQFNAGGIIQYQ